MRKIREYYEEAQEPLRSQLLRNMKNPETSVIDLKDAIALGFVWRDSPEGALYWADVCNKLEKS